MSEAVKYKRVRMEDLFILPMFKWTWNSKTQTTDTEFMGWHAYTINERGFPYLPIPFGSAMGGAPHDSELYPTPEAAFDAAQSFRKEKANDLRGVQTGGDAHTGTDSEDSVPPAPTKVELARTKDEASRSVAN